MELGQRVKAAREYAKLTQVQLSDRVGMKQQTLSDLERGKNDTSSKLPDIAFTCGVETLWLVREEGPMVSRTANQKPDSDSEQLQLAVIALLDAISARGPAEAKALGARLAAARKQYEEDGRSAKLLRNLEGVVADAAPARKHGRPRGKRR